jgi:hypothetical protein
MTTKSSIALAYLLKNEAYGHLPREMTREILERVMRFDLENLCAVGYRERIPDCQNSRTATAGGHGAHAPARVRYRRCSPR